VLFEDHFIEYHIINGLCNSSYSNKYENNLTYVDALN